MLYMRHVVTGINQYAFGVDKYSAGAVYWKQIDLRRIDVKTSKILKHNGFLHSRTRVAGLYRKRKTGGKGLISGGDCELSEQNGLWEYMETSNEPMPNAVKSQDFLKEIMGKKVYEKNSKDQKEDNW